jgi:hypothetical protein
MRRDGVAEFLDVAHAFAAIVATDRVEGTAQIGEAAAVELAGHVGEKLLALVNRKRTGEQAARSDRLREIIEFARGLKVGNYGICVARRQAGEGAGDRLVVAVRLDAEGAGAVEPPVDLGARRLRLRGEPAGRGRDLRRCLGELNRGPGLDRRRRWRRRGSRTGAVDGQDPVISRCSWAREKNRCGGRGCR